MSYSNTNKAGMIRTILCLFLLATPFAAMQAQVGNISSRTNNGRHLSTELANLADNSTDGYVDVIIQFKQAPGNSDRSAVLNAGGIHKKSLGLVNGSVYTVPVKSLHVLENSPKILY